MRKILVAGNWKMHGSRAMVQELLAGLKVGTERSQAADMAVFPPYPFLPQTQELLPAAKQKGLGKVSCRFSPRAFKDFF